MALRSPSRPPTAGSGRAGRSHAGGPRAVPAGAPAGGRTTRSATRARLGWPRENPPMKRSAAATRRLCAAGRRRRPAAAPGSRAGPRMDSESPAPRGPSRGGGGPARPGVAPGRRLAATRPEPGFRAGLQAHPWWWASGPSAVGRPSGPAPQQAVRLRIAQPSESLGPGGPSTLAASEDRIDPASAKRERESTRGPASPPCCAWAASPTGRPRARGSGGGGRVRRKRARAGGVRVGLRLRVRLRIPGAACH